VKKQKQSLITIILAAGEGTRMKSRTPKVLHTIGNKPLLQWVLDASEKAGATRTIVVLGHQAADVAKTLSAQVDTVTQTRQLGTGHAVKMAQKKLAGEKGEVLILCGDAPLIRPQTLKKLVREHRRRKTKATILTARITDPYGYGRIIRDLKDSRWVTKIVEEKEAGPAEKSIHEINSGAYCFSMDTLREMLGRLKNNNKKGEYYLTDIIGLLRQAGERIAAVCVPEASEIVGINTRRDLATAAGILNQRKIEALMESGVTIWDPARTWIGPDVVIGRDTQIFPGTVITGKSVIGRENCLGPDVTIDSSRTGLDVTIRYSVVEHATLANAISVGPYSHLRKGTVVESGVHIGNFAETNRSRLKQGVKVGHVAYLGDATIGRKTNIGAGTIIANYDGIRKQATLIGEKAFIGSGSILIAPCRIGKRALTGAGAVVKAGSHIPAGTVAVGVPARVVKKRK